MAQSGTVNDLFAKIKDEPDEITKVGIKSARTNRNTYDDIQIKNVKRAQKIAIELIKHGHYKHALYVTLPLCNHIMGPNKNSAVQTISAEFFKYKQSNALLKIALTLAPLAGQSKSTFAAGLAKRFARQGHVKQATQVAELLEAHSEHYAHKSALNIFNTDDPNNKFFVKPLEFDLDTGYEVGVQLAIKCAKSNKNIYNPVQRRNIQTATNIGLDLVARKSYKDALRVCLQLCNASMGYLKSNAVVDISEALVANEQINHVMKIASVLAPLKGQSKMFTIKKLGNFLLDKEYFKQSKMIVGVLIKNKADYALKMAKQLHQDIKNKVHQDNKESAVSDEDSVSKSETDQEDFAAQSFLDEIKKTLDDLKKEDPEASGYVLVPEKPNPLEKAYELVLTDTYFYYKLILTNTIYYIDFVTNLFYKDRNYIDSQTFLTEISPLMLQVSEDSANNNAYVNALKKERLAS